VPFIISSSRWQSALVTCVGITLVVAALAAAKTILIPIVLAVLLTFVLSPIVLVLRRYHIGRVPAALLVVVLVFSILAGLGWIVFAEIQGLATDLPRYKAEIMRKIDSIREVGEEAWLGNIRKAIHEVEEQFKETSPLPGAEKEPEPVARTDTAKYRAEVFWAGSAAGARGGASPSGRELRIRLHRHFPQLRRSS
jgi:hypothetical protein